MTFHDLSVLTEGRLIQMSEDPIVSHLLYDSRKPFGEPERCVFFAISGKNHDGHDFIHDLYENGIRQFVVEREVELPSGANILLVDSSIRAIQKAAIQHREASLAKVIGITGSNGKTIVKEWLYQMLTPSFRTKKSPSSYNSQLGVPLSVWELSPEDELGIFEAGISTTGEMDLLEKIIRPDLGIFTNIGSAHDEGFSSREEKIREKMRLFYRCEHLIYCRDHEDIALQAPENSITWGRHEKSDLRILSEVTKQEHTKILLTTETEKVELSLPFIDQVSIQNMMHVITMMHVLDKTWQEISDSLAYLRPLRMRLELKHGINGCYLIDDTYNNDLAGLKNALDFLTTQHHKGNKTLIVSDILQTGIDESDLANSVNGLATKAGIDTLICIGEILSRHSEQFSIPSKFYKDTNQFLASKPENEFIDEMILIKGARPFKFEKIVNCLEEKIHRTVLEVDLGALTHNLNFYRSRLQSGVKIMVMVKAFAYGAGSVEIARLLQFHKINYLGVAYADEGVMLRKNNIDLPVMVMNPSADSFPIIFSNDLEPEIYNLRILEEMERYLDGRPAKIHIKIDTGMKRLGFESKDLEKLMGILRRHAEWEIVSIFSHLAGADEADHTAFSIKQTEDFNQIYNKLCDVLPSPPDRHIVNSAGILRYPEFQFEMVRLGIGLYGVESNHLEQNKLRFVSSLFTVISQIKHLQKGETVGYGRKGVATQDMTIATIAIGYADGYSRAFSMGKGRVMINGHLAPVIGNVCMDMTMVDITGIPAAEGDRAEIFGSNISLEELASTIETIPYEILTNVSQRVKRVFYTD